MYKLNSLGLHFGMDPARNTFNTQAELLQANVERLVAGLEAHTKVAGQFRAELSDKLSSFGPANGWSNSEHEVAALLDSLPSAHLTLRYLNDLEFGGEAFPDLASLVAALQEMHIASVHIKLDLLHLLRHPQTELLARLRPTLVPL
jgi:hypothetical protein